MSDGRQRDLWDLTDLISPMTIRTAVSIGLVGALHQHPSTAEEIARATDVSDIGTRVLLKALEELDLVEQDDVARWTLTEAGLLLADRDGLLAQHIDSRWPLARADLAVVELEEAVRTGTPAYPRRYGEDFWSDLLSDPAQANAFNDLMSANARDRSAAVVDEYPWEDVDGVLDLGGGDGELMIEILRDRPHLRGGVLDIGPAAAAAHQRFAQSGLADRTIAIPGSFLDEIPPGWPAYLLSQVLHNWNAEGAADILRRCGEAAGLDGRVLVVEEVAANRGRASGWMGVRMFTYFGGEERNTEELAELADSVGLRLIAVHGIGVRRVLDFRVARLI